MPGGQAGGVSFRAGVVIVIRHPFDGRVMAFERANPAGQWQLPQGGLDVGERPYEAALRELAEETGLTAQDVSLVEEFPEWLAYEWPEGVSSTKTRRGTRLGQVHRWFVFVANSVHIMAIPDEREFVDWAWVEPSWLIDNVAEFRRPAYRKVLGPR